jgi:hypothetical protein
LCDVAPLRDERLMQRRHQPGPALRQPSPRAREELGRLLGAAVEIVRGTAFDEHRPYVAGFALNVWGDVDVKRADALDRLGFTEIDPERFVIRQLRGDSHKSRCVAVARYTPSTRPGTISFELQHNEQSSVTAIFPVIRGSSTSIGFGEPSWHLGGAAIWMPFRRPGTPAVSAQEVFETVVADHVSPLLRAAGFRGPRRHMSLAAGAFDGAVEIKKMKNATRWDLTMTTHLRVEHRPSQALAMDLYRTLPTHKEFHVRAIGWGRYLSGLVPDGGVLDEEIEADQRVEEIAEPLVHALREYGLPELFRHLEGQGFAPGVTVVRDAPYSRQEVEEGHAALSGGRRGSEGWIDVVLDALDRGNRFTRSNACWCINHVVAETTGRYRSYHPLKQLRTEYAAQRALETFDDPDRVLRLLRREALGDVDGRGTSIAVRTLELLASPIDGPSGSRIPKWTAEISGVRRFDGTVAQHAIVVVRGETAADAAGILQVDPVGLRPATDDPEAEVLQHRAGRACWRDLGDAVPIWHVGLPAGWDDR